MQVLTLQQGPVETLAGAALTVVENVFIDMAQIARRERFTYAEGFPDLHRRRKFGAQGINIGLVFAAVQLYGG